MSLPTARPRLPARLVIPVLAAALVVAILVLIRPSPAAAALVGLEIAKREDVAGGKAFGSAGPYEKIVGSARFELDPADPANRAIVDLDLAPRISNGRVEFAADVYILRPKTKTADDRVALLEISNRGNKAMLGFFSRAQSVNDPAPEADFGDGWLMSQGYTLVWIGWQFDVPHDPSLVRLHAPPVRAADGRSVEGPVRVDFVPGAPTASIPLGDRNHIPYPVSDPSAPDHVLTVRDGRFGERTTVDRDRWHFVSAPVPGIALDGGFQAGRIYELVYRAKDPVVVGAGFAAVRDLVAWLKHDAPADLMTPIAYAFGISQSGRFLRHFLYQGFNADERGQRVFDAMLIHVAGGGRGSFNHRFAQPSRDAHQYSSFFYPTDLFPFTESPEVDPDTGRRDGLDARYREKTLLPRIFITNTSYEYYGRAASLVHTTPDATADIEPPPHARAYLLTGGMHFPGPFPPAFAPSRDWLGTLPLNPNDYRWTMRALLRDLDDWVRLDKAPPASRIPTIARGTLVTVDRSGFPALPGIARPERILEAYRVDYGPRFDRGVVDFEPPKVGKTFATRVPRTDADGNELDGIRMPDVDVPLATYTGWNLRSPEIGAPRDLANYSGAFIPFAKTRAEREATGDPRPSIAERYPDSTAYLARYSDAVDRLVADRLILPGDKAALMARGRTVWDWMHR